MVQGDEGLIRDMMLEVEDPECTWVLLHLEGNLHRAPIVATMVR